MVNETRTNSTVADPALLAEIEALQLAAKEIAQGALAGMHRSLRRGTSIEFSEHKLYTPGDDIRHIDWRAFAKTDRYHIKQFEDETNLTLQLFVDQSSSMRFYSPPAPRRIDYAKRVAAALTYLALRQGDSTGLISFSSEQQHEIPSRATGSHLLEILSHLAPKRAGGTTTLTATLERFVQQNRRRAVVVVLSDLFDPDPGLFDSLQRMVTRGHDVSVLHLLDRAELEFPYDNPSLFVAMEDTRRLFVHPRTLKQAFVQEMQNFLKRAERAIADVGAYYQLIDTQTPPAEALRLFLRHRTTRR